jgi:hypothetical protein
MGHEIMGGDVRFSLLVAHIPRHGKYEENYPTDHQKA